MKQLWKHFRFLCSLSGCEVRKMQECKEPLSQKLLIKLGLREANGSDSCEKLENTYVFFCGYSVLACTYNQTLVCGYKMRLCPV